MVKILLSGCCGKMGTVISNLVSEFPNLEIIAGIDKFPRELNYPVFTTPNDVNIEYDVLLDFSNVSTLHKLLELTERTKKPLVICSTGYSQEDLDLINEKSKTLPLFKSANMSLGINLINSLLRKVTPLLYGNYDIEIIEKHHSKKLDSPSGTAVMIANGIKEILPETECIYGRYGRSEKRKPTEVGIHAIRGGTIIGEHTTIFAGHDEVVEIKHTAQSKDIFAKGAIAAAKFLANKEAGYYNMNNMLD